MSKSPSFRRASTKICLGSGKGERGQPGSDKIDNEEKKFHYGKKLQNPLFSGKLAK